MSSFIVYSADDNWKYRDRSKVWEIRAENGKSLNETMVTYGVVPAGAEEVCRAKELFVGGKYVVVIPYGDSMTRAKFEISGIDNGVIIRLLDK